MSEEQIPNEEGIYEDADNGYETARVTIAPTKIAHDSMSLQEFEKNYPILMAEARAKHFRSGETYLINDYKIYASGTLRPEVERADENGLVTYVMTQISDPSCRLTSESKVQSGRAVRFRAVTEKGNVSSRISASSSLRRRRKDFAGNAFT